MELLASILLISIITVFVIDLSGAVEHLVKPIVKHILRISREKDIDLPLIGCSLCVTFWSGLVYLIASGSFGLPGIALVSIVSFLTPAIADAMRLFKDIITKLIDSVYLFLRI